jgi:hypothetical protein
MGRGGFGFLKPGFFPGSKTRKNRNAAGMEKSAPAFD